MKAIVILLFAMLGINALAQKTEFKPVSPVEIPDSVRPPQRLVWNGEKGVFLTQRQEELTLEKLQWKDIYKNDAITFYMVSLQLNNRVADLERLNADLKRDVLRAEDEAKSKNTQAIQYQKLWEDEKAANAALKDKNLLLGKKLNGSRALNIGLGIVGLGLGYIALR